MNEQVKKTLEAIGAMAEMAHAFYVAMINAGADRQEASAAMSQFLHTTMTMNQNNQSKDE